MIAKSINRSCKVFQPSAMEIQWFFLLLARVLKVQVEPGSKTTRGSHSWRPVLVRWPQRSEGAAEPHRAGELVSKPPNDSNGLL